MTCRGIRPGYLARILPIIVGQLQRERENETRRGMEQDPESGESGSGGATLLQFWQRQERQSQTRMTSWASTPRLNASSTSSSSAAVETSRGFVPSDVASDPRKKEFLTDLSKKIFSPAVKSKSLIQLNKRLMVRESNPGLLIIFLC